MNIIQVPAYFFTAGRDGNPVTGITVHWMDGTMASADATFTGGSRQASAHYGVEDGTVHQYVQERDTAWACGNWAANLDTVSIEHSAQPGRDATDATYQTSGQLIADICTRHGITPGPGTIRPHYSYTATDCSGTVDIPRLTRIAQQFMTQPEGETEMNPEQARMLQAIYDAIFNGGSSMPGGLPMKDYIAQLPRRTAEYPINGRPGGPVPWVQDTANATTDAGKILTTVQNIATKIGA